jgi:radical SAM protein with 4Fe4S-binding SPASM domain
MSFETFQTVLDRIPGLTAIALFNWGEPFLHPQILRFVRLATDRHIYTAIHSNFSIKKPRTFFTEVVESGLSQLTVSLDGCSQESLSKYRVGADLDLILSNLKTIRVCRAELRCTTPRIIWKFVVNKFNEHEVEIAKRMAGELGVEFLCETMGLGDDLPHVAFDGSLQERMDTWLPTNEKFIAARYRGSYKKPLTTAKCDQLFSRIVVNPDGTVFPCCYATGSQNFYGNLLEQSLEEIWTNDKYLYSRGLFTGIPHQESTMKTICTTCDIYTKCHS